MYRCKAKASATSERKPIIRSAILLDFLTRSYDYQWTKNGLIHLLLKLVAYKMKEGFTLVGNFVYEDLTLHGMSEYTSSRQTCKEGSESRAHILADHSRGYCIELERKKVL